jgi:DNA ligase (NAD+)
MEQLLKLNNLKSLVRNHDHNYYVLDKSIISDSEYDALLLEIRAIEAEFPELITSDSPTQRVGGKAQSQFEPITHSIPMLSLANTFDRTGLNEWFNRVSAIINSENITFTTELKIDGLAISLIYENGIFTRGSTRGNGLVGEDVTSNLKTIKSIPLSLNNGILGILEIRGEIYMPLKVFNKINEFRAENDQSLMANPRNAASGSIRQLDPNVTSERELEIWIYSLSNYEYKSFNSHFESLNWLQGKGFRINPHTKPCGSLDEVQQYYEYWTNHRYDLGYDIDGIVIKVDSLASQNELGFAGREPRWAIAYKFPSEKANTKLIDIGINIGRTGSVNPYAILTPINIGGVIVTNASLHNEEDILRKDIRIGDTVIVERAGDVIPHILGPVLEARTGNEIIFSVPNNCPECGSIISKLESIHRCTNSNCPAIFLESVKHFVSKNAMDIDGLGEQWCSIFVNNNMIHRLSDIYKLTVELLNPLDRMGDTLADKIISNINASKNRPLDRLIFSLGILHVGSEIAIILVDSFKSLSNISQASYEELLGVEGIGPKIAESITEYFKLETNLKLIEELSQAGLSLEAIVTSPTSDKLTGLTFVITGILPNMTRGQMGDMIKTNGGKVTNTVTKNTSYLIIGDSPGSKHNQAQKLGTEIIEEHNFLEILSNM